MSTPFSWESQRTTIVEPFKRTLPQTLRDAVDNMFEGTLNPGAHRQSWFDFLNSSAAGDVALDLGITEETDLSLMLPPIENIYLPLLDQLRETLSEMNADACCYPYSARNATEIKTIVNLYNAVKAKVQKMKGELQMSELKLNKEELIKTGLKVTLLTRPTMPTSERKKTLSQLATQVSRIRSRRRAILKQKKDSNMLINRQLMFRDRLERTFFSSPKWKFKDTRGGAVGFKDTRGGAVGSVDRINPNDIEIISSGQIISHQTIVEAIQERVSGLKQSSMDIHPIAWKNLLIIPYAVQGLTPNWDQAEGKDYRLGQARNKIKTNNFRRASALIATWEQFATYGTKGFANTLQKDLQAHNVKLKAQVEISFDVNGTIRPNVPWWDNEYAAENGKRQVGGYATAEEEVVRDSYSGGGNYGVGVGIHHTKTSQRGVQFISQVGFAWQYKIPTHSRSRLDNTDWILATDENGDPFKEFNLPKGTTEYAVRLCFIKADGNVVPLSNVLTGSDVQQRMEAILNKKIRGNKYVPHSRRYGPSGDKVVKGTREDAKVWNQVTETDRKRLTRKARALLNITSEVNMETFQQKIVPLKQILNSYDALVDSAEARLQNVLILNAEVDNIKEKAEENFDQKLRMDGAQFTDPISGLVIAAPVRGSSGLPVAAPAQLVAGFKAVDSSTTVAALNTLFKTTVTNPSNSTDDYDSQNPIDVLQQAKALKRAFNDPETSLSISARDSAIDRFNSATTAVEDMEQKMVEWSAGGHYDNFSTEHAPGLVSKDREVTQVISFTKTTFPSKMAKEERENNAAIAAGAARGPHRRPGYWNPFTEDLPDEACLMLEPYLRTFRDEESLGMLNAGQLRAHNYSGSPGGTVDVSGDTPSIGFTAWKNLQSRMATKFNDARNPRDLTPDEQRINDFNSRNISGQINFSMKSSRASALIKARKLAEKEQREKFEREEAVLKAQLEAAENARAALKANRDAELAQIRANDSAAQATLTRLTQLQQDTENARIELATKEANIKSLEGQITALEARKASNGLDASQQAQLTNYQTTMSVERLEISKKIANIERLQTDFNSANDQYNKDVASGIQKKEQSLDKKITDAKEDLKNLNIQYKQTLAAAETAAQVAAAQLETRVQLMVQATSGDLLGLEKDIISGNIAIEEKNKSLSTNQTIAPADLRFGGGYYWKESEDIKSNPFGQYLAYDSAATSGDRMELMWSELNPDDSSNNKKDIALYRYTDANTPSVKASVRRSYVQPVLSDKIYVKGVDSFTKSLTPTQNLFRLTKANTQSKSAKGIVYLGRTAVGDRDVELTPGAGVTREQISVLNFYETLPKPGTFVHFVVNKKSPDEARIITKFGNHGSVRNRLRVLSDAFSVDLDNAGNAKIVFDDPESLVGLSGRIESVHIANLKTTLNAAKEKTMADALVQLEANRATEIAAANDPAKIKSLTDSIITETKLLQSTRANNGRFNFGKYKSDSEYQAVVVADVRISSDDTTGIVKNVLFADIAVVNPYSNKAESTVLYKTEGRYKEYQTGVYHANKDDTVKIVSGRDILTVNKENLLPRLENNTPVMYFNNGTYGKGKVISFGDGLYKIDKDAVEISINPDDVSALEDDSNNILRTISTVNTDINTISLGLRKSQYVALYHKLSVEDVQRGATMEKFSNELEAYVGQTTSQDLNRGFSDRNENNFRNYNDDSFPPTFVSSPDSLFRAEFTPKDPLEMFKVSGNINSQAVLEDMLNKLGRPGATSRNLADDKNTYDVTSIMGDVVMVGSEGLTGRVKDSTGAVISGQYVTIRYAENGTAKYANISVDGLSFIKVPHTAADIKPTDAGLGYTKVSDSQVQNMVPQKAINITAPVRSSLMVAKSMAATFALTSGTEGDTDLVVEEDDEKGGWTSSWVQDTVAAWAASSSSSDEQMLKAMSDVDQMIPNWASSSSGDESVEKAAWATTSASGGFASSTSDDDADDLATIISKIDRVSKPVFAAWAEDSESEM
jgi:hypothetical protein